LKDFISELTKQEIPAPPETAIYQDKLFYKITNTLDRTITLRYDKGVPILPKAIVLDLGGVPFADLTAVQGLQELRSELAIKGVGFVTINANATINAQLKKFGVVNSKSTADTNLDDYLQYAASFDEMDADLVKATDLEHVVIAKEV
jgi:MFS superfamily sulfate permease-like transporter